MFSQEARNTTLVPKLGNTESGGETEIRTGGVRKDFSKECQERKYQMTLEEGQVTLIVLPPVPHGLPASHSGSCWHHRGELKARTSVIDKKVKEEMPKTPGDTAGPWHGASTHCLMRKERTPE